MSQQNIAILFFILAVSLTVQVGSVPDDPNPYKDHLIGGRVPSKSKSDELYEQARKLFKTDVPVYMLPDKFFPETDRDAILLHDSLKKVNKHDKVKPIGNRAESNKNKEKVEIFFLTSIDRMKNIMLTIMHTILKIMAVFS